MVGISDYACLAVNNGRNNAQAASSIVSGWDDQQNPAEYIARSPRLQELSKRFTSNMPVFTMGEKNREKLAEYLLEM